MWRAFRAFALLALVTGSARADLLTVGPAGTYATIQAGIDAALALGGDHEIRIQSAMYSERVRLETESTAALSVTGCWQPGFLARDLTPGSETVLQAPREVLATPDPTLRVSRTAGALDLGYLTLRGFAEPFVDGVGLELLLSGGAEAGVTHVTAQDFVPNIAGGAALQASVSGNARLVVSGIHVLRSGPSEYGATAAQVQARDAAVLELRDSRFESNRELALGAWARDQGQVHVSRVHVRDGGWGLGLSADGEQSLVRVTEATLAGLSTAGELSVAVIASPHANGQVQLSNLTIVDNRRSLSIQSWDGGRVHLSNSILVGGAPNVTGSLTTATNNWIGSDPGFVDRANGDYHLALSSRAIDGGHDHPPGGLGSADIDGEPRIQGRAVDVGADEVPSSGCRVLGLPMVEESPLCRCVPEGDLVRCGLRLPALFVSLRAPIGWEPFEPFGVEWSIQPWTAVGGPYSLVAEAEIAGDWTPQEWQGPTRPSLKTGEVVLESIEVKPGKLQPTPLRTTFKYQPLGEAEPRRVTVEVLLGKDLPKVK